MQIKNQSVLVTGGAGNIGSHIIDHLLSDGASRVVVIDNFCRGREKNLAAAISSGKVDIYRRDISDYSSIQDLFKGIDYVFHEAAIRITQCAQDAELCQKTMIDGTYNVFKACVAHKIKKIVFASSASVYGDPSYLPMDEGHPYNNRTFYGVGKIYAEHLARTFREMFGLSYIGLRYFNVYGPRMDAFGAYTEVMIRWLDRLDEGKRPVIFGDGMQSMDFVYISDVARANILALKSQKDEGIYNVGSGTETDLNTLCREIIALRKPGIEPEYKDPEKLVIVSRRRAGIERSRSELGFSAEVGLSEGLRHLIIWRDEEKKSSS